MTFIEKIKIKGINPYVDVPPDILEDLFRQAGRDRGPIPVCGLINNQAYIQTLMKHKGRWLLYINTKMLKNSPKRVGETIEVTIGIDNKDRSIQPHPDFVAALRENEKAKAIFDGLTQSKKHEIVRYIAMLKTEESVKRNIDKAIQFLMGTGRFVGRDQP